MWFPYYFTKLNFSFSLTLIAISYHLMITPGTIIFETVVGIFPNKLKELMMGCLIITFILASLMFFIEPIEENSSLYILIVSAISLTQSGPCNRTVGV